MISPADPQASEKLYQLVEIIGVSRTLPGIVGLWALVVDAALCDASAMSGGLLATLMQEDDTESVEDSLLERAIAMEAIEGDVTDYDMCMGLIQTMQEVFDHAIFQ